VCCHIVLIDLEVVETLQFDHHILFILRNDRSLAISILLEPSV